MMSIKSHIFVLLIGLLSVLIFIPDYANAQNQSESSRARALFHESMKVAIDDKLIPTFQGEREITIHTPRGIKISLQFRDGFSKKHGGYRFRLKDKVRPQHLRPDADGDRPGWGRNIRERPDGRRDDSGRGMVRGRDPDRPGMSRDERDRPLNRLMALIDTQRPKFEPMFHGQRMAARKLLKDDQHLVYKGPFDEDISGRKTHMIQIEPRHYKGGSLRIWLDSEKKIPLKTERINHDGRLVYTSEYLSIDFVDDDEYEFTQEIPKPDIADFIRGSERGGKKIPTPFMHHSEIKNVPKMDTPYSFDLLSMRRMPVEFLPGVHYVFGDGLNTISVFSFDTEHFANRKRADDFAQRLGETLDSKLPYPVLAIKEKDFFIMITSDMNKDDLKKISRMIAFKNIAEIRKIREAMQRNQNVPPSD